MILPIDQYKDSKYWKPSKIESIKQELNTLYSNKDKNKLLDFENQYFYTDIIGTKNRFCVGKIYNFDYFYDTSRLDREFIDTRPNVLVYREYYDEVTKQHKFSGIDLNYLPDIGVVVILNFFAQRFRNDWERSLDYIGKNIIPTLTIGERDMLDFYNNCRKLFNLAYASRTYKKNNVIYDTVKVVRLQDYINLFLYTGYEKSLKGVSPQEIKSNWFKR